MSKEHKHRSNVRVYTAPEPEPVIPYEDLNAVGKSTYVVNEAEWRYLSGYDKLGRIFSGLGMAAQAAIAWFYKDRELQRLNPQGQWSVENGDQVPSKNTDWGNL